MQPLKMLNNVQKARLLHSLLIQEIPEFLGYLNELTETVLNDKERIKEAWKDQMFGVDFWFELAEQVQRVMAKYPKELSKSSSCSPTSYLMATPPFLPLMRLGRNMLHWANHTVP
jgi:hypothetical protein